MDDSTEAFQTYRGRVGHILSLVVSSLLRGQSDGSIRADIDPLPRPSNFGRVSSAWCWSDSTKKVWREFLCLWI